MANEFGLFFDSVNGDRTYNSDSFAEWLQKFFTTGVFNGDLQVQPSSGMAVNVGTGYANINGRVRFFDTTQTKTLPVANGTYPRIDTIVVRLDLGNRQITCETVQGTYSGNNPSPTAPVRSDGIYEIVLAQIYVGAGVTEITTANITDTRADETLCGWVTSTVESVPMSQIVSQMQAEFLTWYDHMKDQLDEDAAGHLQQEIDTITSAIEDMHDSVIVQFLGTGWLTSETVNGVLYYTQEISVTKIHNEHPEIGIVPISGMLPTSVEQDAYDSVEYITVDTANNIIKGYATSIPSDTFAVIVKGAK